MSHSALAAKWEDVGEIRNRAKKLELVPGHYILWFAFVTTLWTSQQPINI